MFGLDEIMWEFLHEIPKGTRCLDWMFGLDEIPKGFAYRVHKQNPKILIGRVSLLCAISADCTLNPKP